MNIESYIKNMPSELQEKARACGSVEELLTLAKEAKVPVPDEALETIASGDDSDPENCEPEKCPRCGSTNVKYYCDVQVYCCNNCGYEWM